MDIVFPLLIFAVIVGVIYKMVRSHWGGDSAMVFPADRGDAAESSRNDSDGGGYDGFGADGGGDGGGGGGGD